MVVGFLPQILEDGLGFRAPAQLAGGFARGYHLIEHERVGDRSHGSTRLLNRNAVDGGPVRCPVSRGARNVP